MEWEKKNSHDRFERSGKTIIFISVLDVLLKNYTRSNKTYLSTCQSGCSQCSQILFLSVVVRLSQYIRNSFSIWDITVEYRVYSFTFTRWLPFLGECQIITKHICFVSIILIPNKLYCSWYAYWSSPQHLLCCVQTHTQIYEKLSSNFSRTSANKSMIVCLAGPEISGLILDFQ